MSLRGFRVAQRPTNVYNVYQDPETTIVVESTRAEALADLADLTLPAGLTADEFTTCVEETLARIPSFQRFLVSIPSGLTDVHGVEITSLLRNELEKADARKQWRIVRDWIATIFRD